MGNQSQNKFKPKSGSETALQVEDPLLNIPRRRLSFRKNSDASSSAGGGGGGVTRSEITRRLSGFSPKHNSTRHRRNNSDGPTGPGSPMQTTLVGDISTLSTISTLGGKTDSESEISIKLETRELSDNSEPSSATVRQSLKEKKDLQEASEIKPWLFLGGVEVAKSKEYLRQKGITHVLNCAHTVCENYHEGDFTYVRPIDIADASKEEIGNFMLQTIADIESVRENQGKILVHCQLGSSRSATLVIAYLMWLENLDVMVAFHEVKRKRSIVSPNLGFMVQLNTFKKRLDWRPSTPTLHRIAPHSPTDGTLVVKLVVKVEDKTPVAPQVEHLDPRGAFLLHSPQDNTMYLWVGPDVGDQAESDAIARKQAREAGSLKRHDSSSVRETYEQAGKRIGKMMSKYEKAFRDENGNPCQFVIVPTNQSAVLALAEGADQNSFAARFWKTLGENVGTKVGFDNLRANRTSRKWTEEEDSATVAYIDSSSSAQFAVTNVIPASPEMSVIRGGSSGPQGSGQDPLQGSSPVSRE
jgi:hypothetical protein